MSLVSATVSATAETSEIGFGWSLPSSTFLHLRHVNTTTTTTTTTLCRCVKQAQQWAAGDQLIDLLLVSWSSLVYWSMTWLYLYSPLNVAAYLSRIQIFRWWIAWYNGS